MKSCYECKTEHLERGRYCKVCKNTFVRFPTPGGKKTHPAERNALLDLPTPDTGSFMRYHIEYDHNTHAMSVRELQIVVNFGSQKLNMRRIRELVPQPSILVFPYMGAKFEEEWHEIPKEELTEPRLGQEGAEEIIEAVAKIVEEDEDIETLPELNKPT